MKTKKISGVIPAHLCPFQKDGSIDEGSYRRHVQSLADIVGLGGVVVNGHAGEVDSLSQKERQWCLQETLAVVNGKMPVYCGVFCKNTARAVEEAKNAARMGADGLLVSVPNSFWMGGGTLHSEMAFRFYSEVAAASDLPIILFSLPKSTDMSLRLEYILQICQEITPVAAIKELSGEVYFYEELWHELQTMGRPVSLLSSFSKSLVSSLAVGGDGLLSGAGSVIARQQLALFEAVARNDLFTARTVAERLWPLVKCFYSAPLIDMHNRMKYILLRCGKIDCDYVREPLLPLSRQERERLDDALKKVLPYL